MGKTEWENKTAEEVKKLRKGKLVRITRTATGQQLMCRVDWRWQGAAREKVLIAMVTGTVYSIKNRPGWEYQTEIKQALSK